MAKTVATVVFIGACAVVAVYLGQRKTIARGDVLEADLMTMLSKRGIAKIECDDEIPIGPRGATFQCHLEAVNGARGRVHYTMDRVGRLVGTFVEEAPRALLPETSGDPWGN